jgi:hypothetical protein
LLPARRRNAGKKHQNWEELMARQTIEARSTVAANVGILLQKQ